MAPTFGVCVALLTLASVTEALCPNARSLAGASQCGSAEVRTGSGAGTIVPTRPVAIGQVVLTATPDIPPLWAVCTDGTTANVAWELVLIWKTTEERFCGTTSSVGQRWDMRNAILSKGRGVIGGRALLYFGKLSYEFEIIGTNPSQASVFSYIQSQYGVGLPGGTANAYFPFFTYLIVEHESALLSGGSWLPGPYHFRADGRPNGDKAGGYGVFQLTYPKPNLHQIFDWQENVKAGVKLLKQKIDSAQNFLTCLNSKFAFSTDSTMCAMHGVSGGSAQCWFQDGTPGAAPLWVAIALKKYNSATSCRQYLELDTVGNQWYFDFYNAGNFSYVERLCAGPLPTSINGVSNPFTYPLFPPGGCDSGPESLATTPLADRTECWCHRSCAKGSNPDRC